MNITIYLLLSLLGNLIGIVFLFLLGLVVFVIATIVKQNKAIKKQKSKSKTEIASEPEPIKAEQIKHEPPPKRFFLVAGTFLPERQKILKDLVDKNKSDYTGKKWKGFSNQKIKGSSKRYYEYGFLPVFSRAVLIHEPENENDPNAIAVFVGKKKDQMIGYVPKIEIEKVNEIMKKDDRNSFKFRVGGGRYKEYDPETDQVKIVNDNYNGIIFYHDYY